jgi:hypothetical protein
MVNFPKMANLHGTFTKKKLFSWENFQYGNISMALMIKIPMLLRNFIFHVLDTITQPVLGKFPIKVKIPMTISNSAGILQQFRPISVSSGTGMHKITALNRYRVPLFPTIHPKFYFRNSMDMLYLFD